MMSDDELYTSLLPAYRALEPTRKDCVLKSFSALWKGSKISGIGGKLEKGEALEMAMILHDILPSNPTIMNEDEYEDIMKAQEIYDAC
jgi:hypothetical protein